LHEIDAGTSIAEAARVHDVHPETIRVWRKMERKYGDRSFAGNGRAYTPNFLARGKLEKGGELPNRRRSARAKVPVLRRTDRCCVTAS
jgi:transposase-like protein